MEAVLTIVSTASKYFCSYSLTGNFKSDTIKQNLLNK